MDAVAAEDDCGELVAVVADAAPAVVAVYGAHWGAVVAG